MMFWVALFGTLALIDTSLELTKIRKALEGRARSEHNA
jgi:hypothetical protein